MHVKPPSHDASQHCHLTSTPDVEARPPSPGCVECTVDSGSSRAPTIKSKVKVQKGQPEVRTPPLHDDEEERDVVGGSGQCESDAASDASSVNMPRLNSCRRRMYRSVSGAESKPETSSDEAYTTSLNQMEDHDRVEGSGGEFSSKSLDESSAPSNNKELDEMANGKLYYTLDNNNCMRFFIILFCRLMRYRTKAC